MMDKVATFQSGLFLAASKNWPRIFFWISFVLLGLLSCLLFNDYIQYEVAERTDLTSEKISLIVYFFHLMGFWMVFMSLIWINETIHRRKYIIPLNVMAGERRLYRLESGNFVNSGTKTTAAPIKTAIIRPTNYYEQQNQCRKSNLTTEYHQGQPPTEYHKACDPNSEVMVLEKGGIEDPLSDSSALLYGTNATCRRRSKVEAWIENSSSAHSDTSDNKDHLTSSPAMKLPSLSPCNLTQNHLDLSYENLCQELLALSASCTTLEQMIGQTELGVHQQATKHSNSSPIVNSYKTDKNVSSRSNLAVKDAALYKLQTSPKTHTEPKTDVGKPPDIPPRTNSSFLAVQKIAQEHLNHRSEVSPTPSPQWRCQSKSEANGSSSLIVSSSKLQALTVDVGHSNRGKTGKVPIPVKNGLITITNPQPCLFSDQQCEKKSASKNPKPKLRTTAAAVVQRPCENFPDQEAPKSEVQVTKNSITHGLDIGANHVAAAIVTQPRGGHQQPTAKKVRKIHRSFSEPAAFITFTPDKRLNLPKSQTKRDSREPRSRVPPQLKIGMDFIRRRSMKEAAISNPHNDTKSVAKDNLLFNNLNNLSSCRQKLNSTDKLSFGVMSGKQVSRYQSQGSDSVFETPDPSQTLLNQPPNFTSTYKCSEDPTFTISSENSSSNSNCDKSAQVTTNTTTTTVSNSTNRSTHKNNSLSKQTNESFSSSFDSEALDILASLKSTNALKTQYNKHMKFPTDVDPITGTPRHANVGVEGKLSTHSGSKSSGSPTSPPSVLLTPSHHPSTRSPKTPVSHRYRQSYYDNVGHSSPYNGVRVSMDSASSSGTVFSRPWGDISKWEDYFRHTSDTDFRHRVDSAVSSQGRITDTESKNHLTPNIYSTVGNPTQHDLHSHRLKDLTTPQVDSAINKHPVFPLPDVTQSATGAGTPSSSVSSVSHTRTSWETSLDRAINQVRLYTKLLQVDQSNCEISRHIDGLVTNSQSLPGTLVGRFITCTWDTHTSDPSLLLPTNIAATHDHMNNNNVTENNAKTDWYSSNLQSQWTCDVMSGKRPLPYTTQAYANDGYLLNTTSRTRGNSISSVCPSLSPNTEHKVLSNVRQFLSGMKRYLLNEPDTQLRFAIQRERVKMASEQFINLDAVLEAVLEKVVLQPLSDHLLNSITSHPDYTLRQINRMESGMKVIVLNKSELFSHMIPLISALDSYKQTITSAFQSIKSEFSPLTKLQYILQTALLIILLYNRNPSHKAQDLQFLIVYALACYGDSTLLVHMAYTRLLIPPSLKCPATSYVFSLYEICGQVYDRLSQIPPTLNHSKMMLYEILDKLCCRVVIADESTNQIVRRSFPLTRWCTVLDLTDIIMVDSATHDVKNHQLYLCTEEKEVLLRPKDVITELLNNYGTCLQDDSCSLVFRRPNTQMLLPHPLHQLAGFSSSSNTTPVH